MRFLRERYNKDIKNDILIINKSNINKLIQKYRKKINNRHDNFKNSVVEI